MALALLSASFQSLHPLPTSKVVPSGSDFCVGVFVYVLGPCGSPVRLGVSPAAASTPKGFSISGLRLYFSELEPWDCSICFAPPLFLLVYLRANVGPPALLATTSWDPPAAPFWLAAAVPALLHNPRPCSILQLLSCPPRSSCHHVAVSPLQLAVHLCPSYLSGWMCLL